MTPRTDVFVVAVRDREWFTKLVATALFRGRITVVHEVRDGMLRGRCKECYPTNGAFR